MSEPEVIEYFKNVAIKQKTIRHQDVNGKRKFAGSMDEALDGGLSKMDTTSIVMILQFTDGNFSNNGADSERRYRKLSIIYGRKKVKGSFSDVYLCWSEAMEAWRTTYSKLYKDRNLNQNLKKFDISNKPVDYLEGELLDPGFCGIMIEINIEEPWIFIYNDADWDA